MYNILILAVSGFGAEESTSQSIVAFATMAEADTAFDIVMKTKMFSGVTIKPLKLY